ncbi:pyocin activator PrtN family protein [Mesorhizobium sp. M1329]|uniref:pyocin activator PrtN family protein n=1 Tax=Mesorhizobium sp. M1329 TaxID=2957083 RepID=UPI003339A274
MAQYEGRVIVPAETVCKDYFSHLTLAKFLRKVSIGEIELPLTRAERSQKSAKGVHLQDLASYLDKRTWLHTSISAAKSHCPKCAPSDVASAPDEVRCACSDRTRR